MAGDDRGRGGSTTSPGRFTAFIGYEWTSNTGGNNLHRNVIFRDNADKASQVEPFTVYPPGSDNPVELWKWMDAYEKKTGGSVLAIAHNGNLSNGTMFPVVEAFGKKVDREYAEERAKWEPLYEVTQTKGDGEAHPFLSPNDEFAAFERWDKGNLDGSVAEEARDARIRVCALGAARTACKLEQELGTNPYKFGMIGSTRRAYRSCRGGGGQFLRQDHAAGAEPASHDPRPSSTMRKTGVKIMDWEVGVVGLRRGVGEGEHARSRSGMPCSARKPMPPPARA